VHIFDKKLTGTRTSNVSDKQRTKKNISVSSQKPKSRQFNQKKDSFRTAPKSNVSTNFHLRNLVPVVVNKNTNKIAANRKVSSKQPTKLQTSKQYHLNNQNNNS